MTHKALDFDSYDGLLNSLLAPFQGKYYMVLNKAKGCCRRDGTPDSFRSKVSTGGPRNAVEIAHMHPLFTRELIWDEEGEEYGNFSPIYFEVVPDAFTPSRNSSIGFASSVAKTRQIFLHDPEYNDELLAALVMSSRYGPYKVGSIALSKLISKGNQHLLEYIAMNHYRKDIRVYALRSLRNHGLAAKLLVQESSSSVLGEGIEILDPMKYPEPFKKFVLSNEILCYRPLEKLPVQPHVDFFKEVALTHPQELARSIALKRLTILDKDVWEPIILNAFRNDKNESIRVQMIQYLDPMVHENELLEMAKWGSSEKKMAALGRLDPDRNLLFFMECIRQKQDREFRITALCRLDPSAHKDLYMKVLEESQGLKDYYYDTIVDKLLPYLTQAELIALLEKGQYQRMRMRMLKRLDHAESMATLQHYALHDEDPWVRKQIFEMLDFESCKQFMLSVFHDRDDALGRECVIHKLPVSHLNLLVNCTRLTTASCRVAALLRLDALGSIDLVMKLMLEEELLMDVVRITMLPRLNPKTYQALFVHFAYSVNEEIQALALHHMDAQQNQELLHAMTESKSVLLSRIAASKLDIKKFSHTLLRLARQDPSPEARREVVEKSLDPLLHTGTLRAVIEHDGDYKVVEAAYTKLGIVD